MNPQPRRNGILIVFLLPILFIFFFMIPVMGDTSSIVLVIIVQVMIFASVLFLVISKFTRARGLTGTQPVSNKNKDIFSPQERTTFNRSIPVLTQTSRNFGNLFRLGIYSFAFFLFLGFVFRNFFFLIFPFIFFGVLFFASMIHTSRTTGLTRSDTNKNDQSAFMVERSASDRLGDGVRHAKNYGMRKVGPNNTCLSCQNPVGDDDIYCHKCGKALF
ncbi:MAG: hypothetical protein E4G74_00785 [Erysipelotrichales bacterium]|nr:MAG: hypothetical protein E4G74_00785 [Erysipelotrichales bacterium]